MARVKMTKMIWKAMGNRQTICPCNCQVYEHCDSQSVTAGRFKARRRLGTHKKEAIIYPVCDLEGSPSASAEDGKRCPGIRFGE